MKFNKRPPYFTFSNGIMFSLVMQDEEICKDVIETIIGSKIGKIKKLVTENQVAKNPAVKFIRIDVSLETEDGTLYDVEMQTHTERELERRMRVYQSMLDANTINRGTPYSKIPDSFVIFICTYDNFDYDEPIYIFESICHNIEGLVLKDGIHKIVVNASAFNKVKDKHLRALLEYIHTNKPTDNLTRRIDTMVQSPAYQESALEGFMQFSTIEMDARLEGHEEGREAGLLEGLARGISQGISQGITQGITQGERRKAVEIAKELLNMGLDIEKIALATNLSLEEIREL